MAKTKPQQKAKSKGAEPTEIPMAYDLFELPTAFHKAGLVGMILLIESLKARQVLEADEARYEITANNASIVFTEALLTKLMNDVYDAKAVEIAVKNKWQAEIVRPPTDAEKEAGTPFVYRVVQPLGRFLKDTYPQMDDSKSWLKLWRDMLWNIPRGRPTTREPFNQRAAEQPCKEGPNAWTDLVKSHKARAKNLFYTAEVSSALFPGAQAVNAEGVPFRGRPEHNVLLHFWTLSALVFAPQSVDRDGTADFRGFTIAVPEVANLTRFVRYYPRMLDGLNRNLKPNQVARGYRPTRSVIDLPAEGALAFMDHLAAITQQAVEGGVLQHSISGAEYLHLVKEGNNVKTLAAGRVVANEHLLSEYHALVFPDLARGDPLFRNPLFRRGLLQSLLEDNQTLDGQSGWYRFFNKILTTFEVEVFIRQPFALRQRRRERDPPQFAYDAANKFRHEAYQFTQYQERIKTMPEPERPKEQSRLSVIINRVVRSYLRSRTKDKTGIDTEKYKTTGRRD